ncbi:DnaB-like helicase N-terminal domain-containing protein [Streptomyces sp. SID1121]|uniref:DnaB-like helicase N-terminal domain-containing protein n=1 Tax=Streptomyces sp. SID1121 TaxID=3425888 RepID=UPI004055F631
MGDAHLHSTPSGRPVDYAEQALLGALLIDPRRLAEVSGLERAHFEDRTHGVVFDVMRTLAAPAPEIHEHVPLWLSAVLEAAQPEAPGVTGSFLHTLVQACPRPQHAAAYAWMIQEGHARRTLRQRAEDLGQTAADATLPDPAAAVLKQADALDRFLDELTGKFPPRPGSLPRTPLPPEPPRDTSEDALDEERLLLAAATAYPTGLSQMRWLYPSDFALPLHGALFQGLTGLARRGDPIDPVIVLWEAQHHGVLNQNLPAADLVALVSTPHGSPEYWGGRMLHRSLLFTARKVSQRIRAFAEDPANTPHQLIIGARRAMADLHAVRARYQRAHTPHRPTATPGAADVPGVPRAGPPPGASAPTTSLGATR